MAVAKPIAPISKISGSQKDKDRRIKRKLTTDTYATQKGDKIIIETKPKRPKKTTLKQKLINDRFYQVECMWKAMTKAQKMAFTAYANHENLTLNGTRRVYDVFKTLGMTYSLNDFLENFLTLKIVVSLEGMTTRSAIITATLSQSEPIEIMAEDLAGLRTVRG